MGLGLLHKGRPGLIIPLGQLAKETPSKETPDLTCGEKRDNRGVRKVVVHKRKYNRNMFTSQYSHLQGG